MDFLCSCSQGRELVIRSMDLAKEKGCGFAYLLATGIYSQKIFSELQYEILAEVEYKDFVDKKGQVVVDLTEEHLSAQLLAYNLNYTAQNTQLWKQISCLKLLLLYNVIKLINVYIHLG